MTTLIRQGDSKWKHDRLGDGTSTIGRAGCLLCCLTEAANRLGTIAHRDPRDVNVLGRTAGAFSGSNALTEKLGRCVGLQVDPRIDGPADVLSKIVQAKLAMHKLLLLHVDHDSTKAKGDPEADHWVLAIEQNGNSIVYVDPATGALGMLSAASLFGESGWSDKRPYKVMGVRAVSRRAADA